MSRRKVAKKRVIRTDCVFSSIMVSRFINRLMYSGKKGTAEALFYKAMDIVKERTQRNPIEVFEEALEKVRPKIEVRARRVGGSNYQVPVEVNTRRQDSLAVRWLVNSSRNRPGRGMENKLAAELMDAVNGAGGAVKKREDVFKMAEANKAFAHYRW